MTSMVGSKAEAGKRGGKMLGIFRKIERDARFTVDEEAFERIRKLKFVYRYTVETVELSSLKHNIKDTIFPIRETPVYQYIRYRKTEDYLIYIKNNTLFSEQKSVQKFDGLINKLKNASYDPKCGIVVVNRDGIIIDGLHRSCILLEQFGEDAHIPVLKLYYPGFGIKRRIKRMLRNIVSTKNKQK